MSVKRVEFSRIHCMDDFYHQLAAQLPLPDYFGNNLDALFDLLSTNIEGPVQICWRDHPSCANHLGHEQYTALIDVLKSAAEERADLDLVLE